MPKRKISAKELAADIRGGMDDSSLMTKYGLSSPGLENAFKKLVQANIFRESELVARRLVAEKTVAAAWKCPACAMPQDHAHDECPQCGVIVAKFLKQQTLHEKFYLDRADSTGKVAATEQKQAGTAPAKGLTDNPVARGMAEAGNKAAEAVGEAAGSAMADLVSSLFRGF
jgi:hypothetical protein